MSIAGTAFAWVGAAWLFVFAGQPALAMDNCPTSGETNCIDVGQTALLTITNRLLQTLCVDSQGHPDDELVRLSVLHAPNTGGATATLTPEVIHAYSERAELKVQTTVETKPGSYPVFIEGVGEHCGHYHGYFWPLGVRPKITGPDSVWGFNGAKPAGYPTFLRLTALPANQPPYTWFLGLGSHFLRFPNGQMTMRTIANTIKVQAVRPTLRGGLPSVSVIMGPITSLVHPISVRSPALLFVRLDVNLSDPRDGYESVRHYYLFDQYGHPFPSTTPLPIAIDWISPQTRLFPGTNWTRPAIGPRFLANPRQIRIAISPETTGGSPATDGIPRAEHPHGGSQKIDCWKAAVFVGGDATHQGVRVKTFTPEGEEATQTWLRYRDHATPEAASCP